MAETLSPPPIRDAVVFREPLLLTPVWVRWLELLVQLVRHGGAGGGSGEDVSPGRARIFMHMGS